MQSAMVGSSCQPSMLQRRFKSCSHGNKLLKLCRYVIHYRTLYSCDEGLGTASVHMRHLLW